jgi:3-deoxy-D-manno-octulosonic-acid transferase
MWRAVYAVLGALAWPFVWLRARRRGDGARIGERFGHVPADTPSGVVWIHTVSAGEAIAAVPLVRALAARWPDRKLLVTTLTRTGSDQARRAFGDSVAHCYAPYDFDGAVRRFLDATEPALLVLFETELWPNLLRRVRERGVPAALVNARLSARSRRRYRWIGGLARDMVESLGWIGCQSDAFRTGFLDLGADPARVEVVGSVKFDTEAPEDLDARAQSLRAHFSLGTAPVWIGASTHDGEDAVLLDAHARLREEFPRLRLLLVPRHPERFDAVAALARRRGFAVARRSDGAPSPDADVLLGDSMGELLAYYALCRIAFIGGSLVPAGGHNPIEAALAGVPMLIGPHDENFADVVALFRDAGVLACVRDAAGLVEAVRARLLDAAVSVWEAGTARRIVVANRGATARTVERLAALLEGSA